MRNQLVYCTAAVMLAGLVVPLEAQDSGEPAKLTKKQEKRRLERLRKELQGPFKRWLDEDVRYIITPEERKAFVQMATDEERENFIESFWMRRDPTPDSMENEYKEEHYRRIAYANDRYASGIPGWKTDRGRIYIDLPIRDLALPLDRGHRQRHPARIRRSHDDWRVPPHDGPVREGRPAARARRRAHAVRADGADNQG